VIALPFAALVALAFGAPSPSARNVKAMPRQVNYTFAKVLNVVAQKSNS